MNVLVAVAMAFGASGVEPETPPAIADASISCTAQRLARFVGPYGVAQSWPVAAALPKQWAHAHGTTLSEPGHVMDGYSHRLYVDPVARSAYVVQQGGIAGTQKVFGPLPVAYCTAGVPPNNSFKPKPLRGSA